jgi:hypothetical protein
MAYVVATKPGRYEVRESVSTPKGPRSRTLASFRALTAETIERAREKSEKPPAPEELIRLALRAGAPVPGSELDSAASETLRRIASGEQPDPKLRRLLVDALSQRLPEEQQPGTKNVVSDAARAATQWIGVSFEDRAEALRELLELADALPIRLRPHEIGFPRLRSI